jgi:hypothetical protein
VWITTAFFATAGALEIALSLWQAPWPIGFWPVWEALGRGLLHFLLAAGLWNGLALCRSIAIVYCLAALATYATAIAIAYTGVPARFPPSVVVQSLFQIPSCVLLLPFLRSERASLLFGRSVFGR